MALKANEKALFSGVHSFSIKMEDSYTLACSMLLQGKPNSSLALVRSLYKIVS